ncbi:MAG: efflux RND transporter permease subunit [Leptospirales bacterium]
MFLSNFSLKRPVFMTMIVLALVISGGLSYFKLGQNLFPRVSFPIISVTFQDPGSGSRMIERRLTLPVENILSTLPGVQHIHSVTVPGASTVTLIFPDNTDPGKMFSLVQQKIQQIRQLIPKSIPAPVISRVRPTDLPLLWVLFPMKDSSGGSLDLSWVRLNLLGPLRALQGVSSIEPIWPPERVVHIWVSPKALSRHLLSMDSLIGEIRQSSLVVPTAAITQGNKELLVETSGTKMTRASLRQFPVSLPGGQKIPLSRIAMIQEGPATASSIFRLDRKQAIAFKIYKKSDADGASVSRRIRSLLAGVTWPSTWAQRPVIRMDRSRFVHQNNRELLQTLVLGGGLTIAVIYLFLGSVSATFIASLAIPSSIISTFAVMKAFHFTLNTLTMLGLSLVVGILVDDAIVVLENISRHRQMGASPIAAARDGVGEIGLAVLATTFSIIAVFAPVAFMKGMFGKFFYEFGLTVSFAVAMSMFISLTLTPVMAARFMGSRRSGETEKTSPADRLLGWVRKKYRILLTWSLEHPAPVLAVTIGALGFVGLLLPRIGVDLVPRTDQGVYLVRMSAGSSSSLAYSDERFQKISKKIEQLPGISSVFYQIGGSPEMPINEGYLYVSMKPREERSISQERSMEMARGLFSGDHLDTGSVDHLSLLGGNGREIPLQVILMGTSRRKLDLLGGQLSGQLSKISGLVDIESPGHDLQRLLTIRPLSGLPAERTVNPAALAHILRLMLNEVEVGSIEGSNKTEDVLLSLNPEEISDSSHFKSLPVLEGSGSVVPLSRIATLNSGRESQKLVRDDRMPSVEVNANIVGDQTLGRVMEKTRQWLKISLPSGYSYRFGGSGDVLSQAIRQFSFALALSVLAVYMVLASQFEHLLIPFVIMVSIPVSIVGAVLALWMTGSSFNLMSAMGLIILFGLVAKNAILLVDYTNTLRQRGLGCREALLEACPVRFRPVIMTTVAMIAGMLPMAFGWGSGGALRVPMALVVIGGLLSSMALTLIVVPVVYDRVNSWYDALASRRKLRVE